MIFVDRATGSKELKDHILRQGLPCETQHLSYADACFDGYGPEGRIMVGVERKRLDDMLQCIDDGRFTGHQRVGMRKMYRFSFLILEAIWRPDERTGLLLEMHTKKDGSVFWSADRPGGKRPVRYMKLRRYLVSLHLGGVVVLYTRDIQQTAYDICELYHYFQKPWDQHDALKAMHLGAPWEYAAEESRSLMSLPALMRKPSLTRRWAKELTGIGVKLSEDAERVFRTPLRLANGDETDWVKVPGVGVKTAQSIVREILGVR